MYLCEVAIVSRLCIFTLIYYMGLCEDYLTCDIAFNAVMPLSRASTRRRYSRIEGVTSGSTNTYGDGAPLGLAGGGGRTKSRSRRGTRAVFTQLRSSRER